MDALRGEHTESDLIKGRRWVLWEFIYSSYGLMPWKDRKL